MTKDILKGAGFAETYNYSFIKKPELFGFSKAIELKNPISSDFKYLRPSLIPGLLKNAESNFRYFDQLKIFELGKIFSTHPIRNTTGNSKPFALCTVINRTPSLLSLTDSF